MSYSNGDYYDAILVGLEYEFGAEKVDELYEKYDDLILRAVMDTFRSVDSPMKVSAHVVNEIEVKEAENTEECPLCEGVTGNHCFKCGGTGYLK